MSQNAQIFDTPEAIKFVRLATLKAALSLELKGMKSRRGFSAYATLKREYGFKGSRAKVLEQTAALVEKAIDNKQKAIPNEEI